MNGLLLIDKDTSMTSHDVVARLRKLLKNKEIGHTGTLDPLASGLMVILVGSKATKLSDFILNGDKSYEVGVRFGLQTDSQDITGKIIEEKEVCLESQKIQNEIMMLQGELELEIPLFSAVKVDGKKLYEYARKQIEIQAPKRIMRFENLEIKNISANECRIHFKCSKGSFVRSWVHKLGQNLGVGACVSSLRRTFSSPYSIDQAVSLTQLSELLQTPDFKFENLKSWIPFNECLPDWPSLKLSEWDEKMILSGQIANQIQPVLADIRKSSEYARLMDSSGTKLLALLEARDANSFKIRKVFSRSPQYTS